MGALLDTNGTGNLEVVEFVKGMVRLLTNTSLQHILEIKMQQSRMLKELRAMRDNPSHTDIKANSVEQHNEGQDAVHELPKNESAKEIPSERAALQLGSLGENCPAVSHKVLDIFTDKEGSKTAGTKEESSKEPSSAGLQHLPAKIDRLEERIQKIQVHMHNQLHAEMEDVKTLLKSLIAKGIGCERCSQEYKDISDSVALPRTKPQQVSVSDSSSIQAKGKLCAGLPVGDNQQTAFESDRFSDLPPSDFSGSRNGHASESAGATTSTIATNAGDNVHGIDQMSPRSEMTPPPAVSWDARPTPAIVPDEMVVAADSSSATLDSTVTSTSWHLSQLRTKDYSRRIELTACSPQMDSFMKASTRPAWLTVDSEPELDVMSQVTDTQNRYKEEDDDGDNRQCNARQCSSFQHSR